jgi:hypothetical protein
MIYMKQDKTPKILRGCFGAKINDLKEGAVSKGQPFSMLFE